MMAFGALFRLSGLRILSPAGVPRGQKTPTRARTDHGRISAEERRWSVYFTTGRSCMVVCVCADHQLWMPLLGLLFLLRQIQDASYPLE